VWRKKGAIVADDIRSWDLWPCNGVDILEKKQPASRRRGPYAFFFEEFLMAPLAYDVNHRRRTAKYELIVGYDRGGRCLWHDRVLLPGQEKVLEPYAP
jgi:hypothetical protein